MIGALKRLDAGRKAEEIGMDPHVLAAQIRDLREEERKRLT